MSNSARLVNFYLPVPDKWRMNDLGADYVYTGSHPAAFMLPNGLKEILDYSSWLSSSDKIHKFPLLGTSHYLTTRQKPDQLHSVLNFVETSLDEFSDELANALLEDQQVVLVIRTENIHAMAELRRLYVELINRNIDCPVVNLRSFPDNQGDTLQLYAATDIGGLLVDGLGDGAWLATDLLPEMTFEERLVTANRYNSTAFGILQAARTRMSKTEYISCPSCGRTLFDLQETTATIRKRTDHLKGIKIGIMGCIVNGPGEMADADYGYVGIGKDKISLYRGQQVIKKSVTAEHAVNELIELIKEDGRWNEPEIE
jgi:(E)-4-hydroxy-3-methylbut-2-enyl-diphosphate synthase